MVELKRGDKDVATALPKLIHSSAPQLLDFIFQGNKNALSFLKCASIESDGQFSAHRHHFAVIDRQPVGCISLWHSELPQNFHRMTLYSLQKYLAPDLLEHVVKINPLLVDAFEPPKPYQLCFGHLAVLEDYQGINIGSKLLAFAIRRAKNLGKSEIALDVDAENQQAIGFYYRWGFNQVKTSLFAPLNQRYIRMTKAVD